MNQTKTSPAGRRSHFFMVQEGQSHSEPAIGPLDPAELRGLDFGKARPELRVLGETQARFR